jgi:hypothetical protein
MRRKNECGFIRREKITFIVSWFTFDHSSKINEFGKRPLWEKKCTG